MGGKSRPANFGQCINPTQPAAHEAAREGPGNCRTVGLKNAAGDAVNPERKAAMPESTFPVARHVGTTT
jgi:hypothetical protein